jgi:hypothetical protein
VIFFIHQTLSEFFGIQSDSCFECLKICTKRFHHENQWQEDSRCGKLVLLIHMSDSRLQIVPRRPEKIHGAWDSTYICKHTLCLYFREDLQSVLRDRVAFVHFVTECHAKSDSIVTAQKLEFGVLCHVSETLSRRTELRRERPAEIRAEEDPAQRLGIQASRKRTTRKETKCGERNGKRRQGTNASRLQWNIDLRRKAKKVMKNLYPDSVVGELHFVTKLGAGPVHRTVRITTAFLGGQDQRFGRKP